VRYHRNVIGIVFDDSTGGRTIRALFRKYQAVVVGGIRDYGGTRGAYIIQVPDTVTTYQGLVSLMNKIDAEVGVDFAFGVAWRDKVIPRSDGPEQPRDTTRTEIPSLSYPDDPDFVVSSSTTAGIIYYRRLMGVSFADSTAGVVIRQLLAKYGGTIAGGMPFTNMYILKFSDPGPTIEMLVARREQVEAEPGVEYVLLLTSQDAGPVLDAR
jgi:hypothetical protein